MYIYIYIVVWDVYIYIVVWDVYIYTKVSLLHHFIVVNVFPLEINPIRFVHGTLETFSVQVESAETPHYTLCIFHPLLNSPTWVFPQV